MSPTAIPGNLLLKNGMVITGSEKNPVDLYRSNVSLLLHGDGANGSTTIVDSSPSPKSAIPTSVVLSTAQSKFGGSSILFSFQTSRIQLELNNAFDFSNDNLTIESWVYFSSLAFSNPNIWSQRTNLSNGITFRLNRVPGGATLGFFYDNIGTGNTNGVTVMPPDSWHHIALTREGSLFKLWLNGNLDATSSPITASMTSVVAPRVGASASSGNEGYTGYIDDLRITKGIARYTANFTPPTAPFPDI
jgi:hypothetical protein